MGRVFMDALDDPFRRIERELEACPLGDGCDAAIVDIHAEATSEKQAFGHFVDGRVSLVVGTHTHIQSADARMLTGGTGFITDVGMTGDYDSVIGMDKEEPVRRFTRKHSFRPLRAGAGRGDAMRRRGRDRRRRARAQKIAPVRIGGASPPPSPISGTTEEHGELIETVVFDLDGTLAETAGDLIGALNVVLAAEGIAPLPVAAARSLLGAGGRALIQRGFAEPAASRSRPKLDACSRTSSPITMPTSPIIRLYFPASRRRSTVRRRRLAPCGVHQQDGAFVASCCSASSASRSDSHSSAARTLSASASPTRSRSSRRSAPPAATRDRAVMVGDSKTDIETARAAGVPVICVDFGYTDIPVAELGPDRVDLAFRRAVRRRRRAARRGAGARRALTCQHGAAVNGAPAARGD